MIAHILITSIFIRAIALITVIAATTAAATATASRRLGWRFVTLAPMLIVIIFVFDLTPFLLVVLVSVIRHCRWFGAKRDSAEQSSGNKYADCTEYEARRMLCQGHTPDTQTQRKGCTKHTETTLSDFGN